MTVMRLHEQDHFQKMTAWCFVWGFRTSVGLIQERISTHQVHSQAAFCR